jgi:SH3 domain-containing YSC84-like protein 1
MLSYSRSKGVFGGVSLSGTSLAPDNDDNETLYGKKVTPDQIFSGAVPASPSGSDLTAALEQTSPKKVVEAAK